MPRHVVLTFFVLNERVLDLLHNMFTVLSRILKLFYYVRFIFQFDLRHDDRFADDPEPMEWDSDVASDID